ncbi:Z-ring formation inhibitor MciZ [Paenibacillus sp. IITD108]|uniref:Z-ring formation inhibitor MciZ n=2 Tax=unclassified Paenibacillus TaxID=185978 RepID=UPI002F42BED0
MMKVYLIADQLRIVGKAWEVRHQLRKLTQQFGRAPLAQLCNASVPSPFLHSTQR